MNEVVKLLGEAAIVMTMGMGVVFSFLIILVICVTISGKLIKVFKLDREEIVQVVSKEKKSDDQQIIAAIAAAVKLKQK